MSQTYFYVFKGDEKIILTLDNFETEGNTILHSFGQAAHFVEGLHLPLEEKVKTLLTLPLFETIEEGAEFLAQTAAESEGYKPDFIKTPFNGSLKEFFYSKFRETFGFGASQLLNISQCQLLQSMDWVDVERRYVNRLGGLIPRSFRYGDTEWVVPEAFDL